MKTITAFAPASVGNVGVGFDILGHTIAGPGDRVSVRRIDEGVVRIAAIRGAAIELPREAERNTAGTALLALRAALEENASVLIEYVDNHGVRGDRVVSPLALEGGQLSARDHLSDEVRGFAVHRISAVRRLGADE